MTAILSLSLLSAPEAAPAQAGGTAVAVVDVARVIDASAPGKAGQRYIDGLKKELDAEMDKFKKETQGAKDAPARLARKESELEARYQAEYTRVTGLLLNELKRAVNGWLKDNKKGIKVVIPASAALGFAQSADISGEILRRLNAAAIDFGKR
ncbi:hypothetical protein [Cloacibacillus porcorum]